MSVSLIRSLAAEAAALLAPLKDAVESPRAFEQLVATLGLVSRDNSELLDFLTDAAELARTLEALASQETTFETLGTVLDTSEAGFTLIRSLAGGPTGVDLQALGRDVVELLVAERLARQYPVAREVAVLLTLVEPAERQPTPPLELSNGEAVRIPEAIDRIHLARVIDLLRDPVGTLRAAYVNDLQTDEDAHAVGEKLFPPLVRLLRQLGVSCRYGIPAEDHPVLGDAAPFIANALVVYVDDELNGAEAEAGVLVTLSPASRGDLGLVVSPFGTITTTRNARDWTVDLQLTAGVEVLAYGRHGFTLLASPGTVDVTASAVATLPSDEDGPAFVLGAPDGVRLEIGAVRLAMDAALSDARQALAFSADLSPATFVIAADDEDGFLASVLPAGGMRTTFDFGISWSSEKGFTFRGHAGLDATIPVGLSMAGLTLSSVHLRLLAREGLLVGEVSATLAASIGPVRALVDRLGIEALMTFPDDGGNVGVADLDIGIKPPSGIGLTVDAKGVVTGGGVLMFDTHQGLYAGGVQLSICESITVKAFGLITTRRPDGGRGYSLLVFITVEDFEPVPLGLGFTLIGIGGMVAVHRTFSEDALREAMHRDTLGTLLFPKDIVNSAAALVPAIGAVFPVRTGSYLFGLFAKITWFTPTLLTMDVGLIFEFGRQRRLLVLGRVSALLPSAENDLVRLNLNAVGIVDFDKGTAAVDAVLVDSRLVHKFVLTGASAFRARWTSGPGSGFILSVGGVNPRFAPPTELPRLSRITVALTSGDNPRVTCDAYFAVTTNTLQFGARANVYAAAHGFSVEADVGFDVLIQLVPFHFVADFRASAQLKRGSRRLFKVTLKGELEGPRPLRVAGKASFEICWCDFSVRFDKTLIDGERPPLPPAVDVMAELSRALLNERSWTARRPAHRQQGVTFAPRPPGGPVLVDPLGTLVVTQQVVPLNTARDVEIFGGAPIAGARRFEVGATLGGTSQGTRPVRDHFVPSQFFEMSDEDRLSSPSFEEMDAGIEFGSDVAFDAAEAVPAPLEFEPIIVDDDAPPASTPPEPRPRYVLTPERLLEQSRTGSAATAPIRTVGLARFRDERLPVAATVTDPAWTIVTETGGVVNPPEAARVGTWSEARAALRALNTDRILFHMAPVHETVR